MKPPMNFIEMINRPGGSAEAADKAAAAWKKFTDGIERSQIRRALDAAGYTYDGDPTEEQLRECFGDYVDAGIWSDLSLNDIEGLSVAEMCKALIRIRW